MADQGQNKRMSETIEKAIDGRTLDKASAPSDAAKDAAEHTRRTVDRMATGNVPHGGDDPQHKAADTRQTPMPNETGGKGNVGDTPMPEQGKDR